MINTPAYEDKIAEATKLALELGHKILQIFRLAADDREHVRALLDLGGFPLGATVLDLGCGIGEVARIAHEVRPDLTFVLLNNNNYQITQCPEGFETFYGDMHHTHFADHSFNGVMLNYALGYARPERLFEEVQRLLKPGGIFFVSDIIGNPKTAKEYLDYKVWTPSEIIEMCPLKSDLAYVPADAWSDLDGLADPEVIERVLHDMRPVYYRFHKP